MCASGCAVYIAVYTYTAVRDGGSFIPIKSIRVPQFTVCVYTIQGYRCIPSKS